MATGNLSFFVSAFFVSFGLFASALASDHVNVGENGLALHGYDPVSYHTEGVAKRGSSFYRADYDNAPFRFASAEHRDLFMAAPGKYMPAYGGFCSYGVRVGKKLDGDPQVWRILDGTLYLQLDQGTQVMWLKDVEKNIAIADRIWPAIRPIPKGELAE